MVDETPIERARRLAELMEGPLAHVRRDQTNIDRIMRTQSPSMELISRLHDKDFAGKLAREFELINRNSTLINDALKALNHPGLTDALQNMAEQARLHRSIIDKAIIPHRNQIDALAIAMAQQVAPFEAAMKAEAQWQRTLALQMSEVHRPWMLQDFAAVSMEGFAKLSRLNDVMRTANPFAAPARDILDEDLGSPAQIEDDDDPETRDAASVDAGFAPEMLAFPADAAGEVLIETGFVFQAEYAPLPTPLDGSDPGLLYHSGHAAMITLVEQNLRQLIILELSKNVGPKWMKQRVSKEVTDVWSERQAQAVADGETPFDLIYYSDFMNLKDIIVRGDNWNEVFGAIFINKNYFTVSMERLHPIRKALAHSRPIGRAQQLVLYADSTVILKALNIPVLSPR